MRAACGALAGSAQPSLREFLRDERTRYLSGASDNADLERRLRAWEAREQRPGPWAQLP